MSSIAVSAPSMVAGGTIPQAAFVKADPAADYQALAAITGDRPIGISQRWANVPSFDGQQSTPPAATIGQGIATYGVGAQCQLMAGPGGWAAGALLMPGATPGVAIVATAGSLYGARALQACIPGELGQVTVTFGTA